jgi:integrase
MQGIPAYDLYELSAAAVLTPPPPPPPAVALDMADEPPRGTGPISLDRLAAELKQNYSIGAKSTWDKIGQVLRSLEALGVTSTGEFTVPTVTRFVAARPAGQSNNTLASLLSSLRAVCTYAHDMGYARTNPFKVKRLSKWVRQTRSQERNHLSREEIRTLLDRMERDIAERDGWAQWRSRRIYAATSIIAYCALRKMECLRLHVADVDLAARVITIVPRVRLKTAASAAPVPMPESLVPILEDWLRHRLDGPPNYVVPECPFLIPTISRHHPWSSGSPGTKPIDALQDAARRAGVKGATFHALRRSWATHAEYHGLGPALIMRVLRHTSERTGERFYRKADLPNLTEKVAGMTF